MEVAEEGHDWKEAWRGLGTSAKVCGLTPGRPHQVRVAASNAVGEGAFSKAAAFSTLLLAPPAPLHLQAEASKECALQSLPSSCQPIITCFSGTYQDMMSLVKCHACKRCRASSIGLKRGLHADSCKTARGSFCGLMLRLPAGHHV